MSNRLTIIVILTVAIIAAVSYRISKSPSNSEGIEISTGSKQATVDNHKISKGESSAESEQVIETPATIASQWQWRNKPKLSVVAEGGDDLMQEVQLPFTEQSVHDALQVVKVDENGNVIMDHDALISLDEALERIHNKLDAESLLKLEDLIKEALPGKTGEQTAALVGDYHQFLEAKEQFDQIHSVSSVVGNQQTVASIESDQSLYKELQALREVHLGVEVTQSLFHDSDVNAEFMFESIKLGLDTSLTQEQIITQRQLIEARRREQMGESIELSTENSPTSDAGDGDTSESDPQT